LQIFLAVLGILFIALIYPLYTDLWHAKWLLEMHNETEPMFLSFFIALGPFLLIAARNPSGGWPTLRPPQPRVPHPSALLAEGWEDQIPRPRIFSLSLACRRTQSNQREPAARSASIKFKRMSLIRVR